MLERLNLARTADEVIATKLADVKTKFLLADKISLDATGRINLDGKAIDASPENAAIYQSLMKTGTIPGLPDSPTTEPGPPAEIGLDTRRRPVEQPVRRVGAGGDEHRGSGQQEHAAHP